MGNESRALLDRITKLEARVDLLARGAQTGTAPRGVGPATLVASSDDLDGKYGDPQVFKDPPRWTGGVSYAGRKYSLCPPEYLDELASFLEWKALRDEASPDREKIAAFNRRDASRARGWAARHRSGHTRAVVPAEPDWDGHGSGADEACQSQFDE